MHVKIQYTEGVLGDTCFVYYKHASDSDSEWQHIRTNSRTHAELIADVFQGYKIKPASKVQVTVNATQTKPAPEPYIVTPSVVQRHRLGDESLYLAEPPWHVGGPRVIHSGSCSGYESRRSEHTRAARTCRVCLGPDLLSCRLAWHEAPDE